MWRIILCFICCTLSVQAENDIYEEIQKKYKQLKTFKADITSEVVISEKVTFKLKGSICYKGKNAWKVRMLKGQKVIFYQLSDGQNHWVLNRISRRVIKSLWQREQQAPKRFFPDFEKYDSSKLERQESETHYTFLLPFKKQGGPFAFISLKVSQRAYVIEQISFLDSHKKENMKIIFSDVVINGEVNEKEFSYEPIQGIEVKTIKE
ncbi:MAG: hypothetical protein HRT88_05605 [Lentisphaeraceae bacterium]|nr:hypothetical protein [Lentisphaeraceae bacterium]